MATPRPRRGKPIGASLMPKPDDLDVIHDPVLRYFIGTWQGCYGFEETFDELYVMRRSGVVLTIEIVDYLMYKHSRDDLNIAIFKERQEAARVERESAESFVYFILNGDRVKIGTSRDPEARALALSLRRSNIIGVISGGQRFEHSLHIRFAAHRIENTEWFHWTPEIQDYVRSHAQKFTKHHRSITTKPPARLTPEQGYARLADALRPRRA